MMMLKKCLGTQEDCAFSLHWFSLTVKDPVLSKRIHEFGLKQYNSMAIFFNIICWLALLSAIVSLAQDGVNSK